MSLGFTVPLVFLFPPLLHCRVWHPSLWSCHGGGVMPRGLFSCVNSLLSWPFLLAKHIPFCCNCQITLEVKRKQGQIMERMFPLPMSTTVFGLFHFLNKKLQFHFMGMLVVQGVLSEHNRGYFHAYCPVLFDCKVLLSFMAGCEGHHRASYLFYVGFINRISSTLLVWAFCYSGIE